jgi:hypothetical protein
MLQKDILPKMSNYERLSNKTKLLNIEEHLTIQRKTAWGIKGLN